jgi:hypothetical protein
MSTTSATLAAAISPAALQELCGFKMLPSGVDAAFQALCIIFSIPPEQVADPEHKGKTHADFYQGFKKHLPPAPPAPAAAARHHEPLSHRSGHAAPHVPSGHDVFIAKMAAYDFASLTKEQFALLTPLVELPTFTVDSMKTKTSAGAAITAW